MTTPICDFVRDYAESGALRLHMPGHKGAPGLGAEPLDVTEIAGADVLYSARGIIRESEENAARLFGSGVTKYSTEGSSLCIRAMLYLARLYARSRGAEPRILAARNAHSVFVSAAALLDMDVDWIYPPDGALLSCEVDLDELEARLAARPPCAVYITSPDYLGNTLDIRATAELCRRHGALLLVDNAHGAYLRFLPDSRHPIDLGADVCCDSAHKTLPVLTGGAYLHISKNAPAPLAESAESAMGLFASTSPSYLVLQSLDAVNAELAGQLPRRIAETAEALRALRGRLESRGFAFAGDEPMKLTLRAKPYGYTGAQLADFLAQSGIVCEFSDADFTVMMPAPETGEAGLNGLLTALMALERRPAILSEPPRLPQPERVMPPREALFSESETLPVSDSLGRVLASPSVTCPPAVPILTCGERIDRAAIDCFRYYGIERCRVVK